MMPSAAYRIDPKRKSAEYAQIYEEYGRRKFEWSIKHPDASPEEYEAAMKKIAREVGL